MNTAMKIAAATAVVSAVSITARIRNRRAAKDVVAETDEIIETSFNAVNAQWEQIRDEINKHPTIARIDAILYGIETRN